MKYAVLPVVLVLICARCLTEAAPARDKRTLNPIKKLGELLHPAPVVIKKPAISHDLIPLSDFPVWRVHHFKGIELKPVKEITEVPLPSKPQDTYGVPEANPLESLGLLDGGLSVLTGIRDALDSVRDSVTSLPEHLLSYIGLGTSDEHDTTAYSAPEPELPNLEDLVQLPEAVLKYLPKLPSLPIALPIFKGKKKIPAVYLVVKKPEIHKEEVTSTYAPPKPTYGLPTEPTSTYAPPKPDYGVPVSSYEPPKPEYSVPALPVSSYEPPKSEYGVPALPVSSYEPPKSEYGVPALPVSSYEPPKTEYGAPVVPVSTYEPPKPEYGVPKEPISSYGPPEIRPTAYALPPFELPSSYENPKPLQSSYGAPQQTYSVSVQTSNSYESPKPVYGAPPNSYNPPAGLVPPFSFPSSSYDSGADATNSIYEVDNKNGGFLPSQGISPRVGHEAASSPVRAEGPELKAAVTESTPVVVVLPETIPTVPTQ